ncbi:MAG TPA: hypothetical protein VHS33_10485 [Sphingomicrobium sp.]|jgi:hypothetical protein|nr:hypothetical protein [Sphingomicrobium sp.]
MADYRIYCVDGNGHIGFADWIAAASNEEAILKARELKPDAHRCELWLQNDLIAKLNDAGHFDREPLEPSRLSPQP